MKQLTKNQQLWLSALRSGEYLQGRGQLQVDDLFCCLGVACKVAEKAGVSTLQHNGILHGNSLDYQPAVIEWLGLKNPFRDITDFYLHALTILNDEKMLTFPQIADHIEKHADLYFV